ncbi:MAG TPA: Rieske 2Fe-2S domain-containing protein [Chloroflexota bacterium]
MLRQEEQQLLTRTGPGTAMGDLFRRFWLPALLAHELPEADCAPVQVKLLGERLVAFRDSTGRIAFIDEWCPHRRASLFYGRNEEAGLRCVYHGWKFDVTGTCVDMPNEPPQYEFKSRVRTTAYPGVEYGGLIWVYMGPPDLRPELPAFEWAHVGTDQRYLRKWHHESNYLQAMEGDIDSSHVNFLHASLSPPAEASAGAVLRRLVVMPRDRAPQFSVRETDYGLLIGARRNADENRYYWRITSWMYPTYALIPAPVGAYLGCNFRVPIDDEHCWSFSIRYHPDRPLSAEELHDLDVGLGGPQLVPGTFRPVRNRANGYQLDREVQKTQSYTGILGGAHQQDLVITETMEPTVDRTLERLGTSDTAIIAVRRLLMKAATDLQRGVEPFAASHPGVYRVRAVALDLEREVDFVDGARAFMTPPSVLA